MGYKCKLDFYLARRVICMLIMLKKYFDTKSIFLIKNCVHICVEIYVRAVYYIIRN